ncbi:hypothetical protein OY671_008283, partial [Metschnikowia pulcherrima]
HGRQRAVEQREAGDRRPDSRDRQRGCAEEGRQHAPNSIASHGSGMIATATRRNHVRLNWQTDAHQKAAAKKAAQLARAKAAEKDQLFAAVNIGSFRVSAMIAGLSETGEMIVLGSGHRAAQGIKRGYVTDMQAATHSVRDAIERAEKMANTGVQKVWIGCSGAGSVSTTARVEVDIGGRRIEQDDIEHSLVAGREVIQPDGRMVSHAQPAHYTLDGAHGVPNPKGLHAERSAVDIHVMSADGAPIRNSTETVQNAHSEVEAV